MGFSRQEYCSGLPCPPPGVLPHPGIKPTSPMAPAWQAGSLPLAPPGKPHTLFYVLYPAAKATLPPPGPHGRGEGLCIIQKCAGPGLRAANIKTSLREKRDFPTGPVAKTLNSQCKGPTFDPWSGNEIPYTATKSSHATTKEPICCN